MNCLRTTDPPLIIMGGEGKRGGEGRGGREGREEGREGGGGEGGERERELSFSGYDVIIDSS